MIKLFYDRQRSKIHIERDVAGIKELQIRNLSCPELYYQGKSKDNRTHILVFERVIDADSLADLWRKSDKHGDAIKAVLSTVMIEFATQHVMGLVQIDCHLNNFMIKNDKVIMLDGGQISAPDEILPKKESIEQIALFLSQLGTGHEALYDHLLNVYAKSRGWSLTSDDMNLLFKMIRQSLENRWQQYKSKLLRASSECETIHTFFLNGMYARQYASPVLKEILFHPEKAFKLQHKVLKSGRSATVIEIEIDHKRYVIKRYNLKNFFHRLRRMFRQTRAEKSWILSNKLQLFGIPVAKPVAYVEQWFLCMTGTSYFISEYVSDCDLKQCLLKEQDAHNLNKLADKTLSILYQLVTLSMTHGDLKSSNLLVTDSGQPVMIDLDGMRTHMMQFTLHSAFRAELIRFLKNFEDSPELLRLFKDKIGKV